RNPLDEEWVCLSKPRLFCLGDPKTGRNCRQLLPFWLFELASRNHPCPNWLIVCAMQGEAQEGWCVRAARQRAVWKDDEQVLSRQIVIAGHLRHHLLRVL